MLSILLVYTSIIGISLLFFILSQLHNDETANRKLVKVRVKIDDNDRRQPLPREEDVDTSSILVWALMGTALLIIVLAVNLG